MEQADAGAQQEVPQQEAPQEQPSAGYEYSPLQVNLVLILFAVSGFAALALEVLWTRALMYFISIDTWAFTAMLCAFLLGIGVGSFVMARCLSWMRYHLSALALIALKPRPGGNIRPFCEPPTVTSTFHSSWR